MKIASIGASATLAAALLVPPLTSAAASPTSLALDYMAMHQLADGSVDVASAGGFGNPGTTEDLVLGASAAGVDPNTLARCGGASAYDWLLSQYGDATKSAGRTGKLILALVAGRRSVDAFGAHDPLADLRATYSPGTGAYGDGGAFTQSLAILGLRAAGHPVPLAARQHLEAAQDGDGGWGTFGTSDTNSTALALEALKAAGDAHGRSAALAFLHTQQDHATGGFILSSGYGPPPYYSDPDSDALVIQALLAVGQDPSGPAWTIAGHNAPADLLTFQDTTSSGSARGGLVYFLPEAAGNQPDTTTTSQVVAAMAGRAFPVLPTYRVGTALGADTCATPAAAGSPAPALPQAGISPSAISGSMVSGWAPWLGGPAIGFLVVLVWAATAAYRRGGRPHG